MQLRFLLTLLPAAGLTGCAAVGHLPTLEAGNYQFLRSNDPALTATMGSSGMVYVEQAHDTLRLAVQPSPGAAARNLRYPLRHGRHVILLDRRFDLDVFTIPFKARPPQGPVPVQLNTNFNAALYFGRRLNFYHVNGRQLLDGHQAPQVRTVGLGYGLFTGLGSTAVSADVLSRAGSGVSYEGFVVHAGAATIYDARIFNLGLAVGFDQLLGPDGAAWLYQRKPWFGVLFGLDLN